MNLQRVLVGWLIAVPALVVVLSSCASPGQYARHIVTSYCNQGLIARHATQSAISQLIQPHRLDVRCADTPRKDSLPSPF